MKYEEMFEVVRDLRFDSKQSICEEEDFEIIIYRPSKLSKRFKSYDVNKNYQIWLKHKQREFRPNHLRVMIDLYLRTRSRPELKKDLLLCFDNIFYHNCPEEQIKIFDDEHFEHALNPLRITAYLHQLFIIEQDYCYHRESRYDPPTLFYQGWLRQFMDSPKEIDNLCMSVCRGQPPIEQYTVYENKKHKNYCSEREDLWYLKLQSKVV